MPSRILNPLTEDGLAAKIVNFCFLQAHRGYNLAMLIYGNNNPHRIYKYLKRFSKKYFKNVDGQYYTLTAPIVQELLDILSKNNVTLNEHEVKFLTRLLDSIQFRKWIGSAIGVEYLAKQGHSIVPAISASLAKNATIIILFRRQNQMKFDDSLPSMVHFYKVFDEQLTKQEQNPPVWPEFDNSRQDYAVRINSKRALFEDLFPEVAETDLSYDKMKTESEQHVNYIFALNLIPSALLIKFMKLDHESAKAGLWSALFPEVKL